MQLKTCQGLKNYRFKSFTRDDPHFTQLRISTSHHYRHRDWKDHQGEKLNGWSISLVFLTIFGTLEMNLKKRKRKEKLRPHFLRRHQRKVQPRIGARALEHSYRQITWHSIAQGRFTSTLTVPDTNHRLGIWSVLHNRTVKSSLTTGHWWLQLNKGFNWTNDWAPILQDL